MHQAFPQGSLSLGELQGTEQWLEVAVVRSSGLWMAHVKPNEQHSLKRLILYGFGAATVLLRDLYVIRYKVSAGIVLLSLYFSHCSQCLFVSLS